jgi:hypothetical protein
MQKPAELEDGKNALTGGWRGPREELGMPVPNRRARPINRRGRSYLNQHNGGGGNRNRSRSVH